jgi:hypothetical protein
MPVIQFPTSPTTPRVRLSDSVRFMPLARWCDYSGLDRPRIHLEIQAGRLKAKLAGPRTLLIDVESGDRLLDELPDAPIKTAADSVPPNAA